MERKKIAIIVILSIVIVGSLLALTPVFIYGFGVNALSFDMRFGLVGTPSGSSSDSYDLMDYDGSSTFTIDADPTVINPYEYFFRQFEGELKAEGENAFQLLNQYVDITILINITTPNDDEYILSYTLEDLVNILMQDINLLLGPDEIEIVSGIYEISIIIEVVISIPEYPPDGYEETLIFGPYGFSIEVIVE